MHPKTNHSLDGKIIKLQPGIAIYKTHASPYWNARIRNSKTHSYLVRSTKEKSRIKARVAALELASDLLSKTPSVPKEFTFKYYATRFLEKARALVARGQRNEHYIRSAVLFLDNDQWGLMKAFCDHDIREIKTRHFQQFMDKVAVKRPDLSPSTRNGLSATFRNVLKVASEDGAIDEVPSTPRTPHTDNPRPFFRFFPLVPKSRDVYKKLLETAKQMAADKVVIRGVPVTDELYDFILFIVHSFVRPISTELYSIRHNDCEIADTPKRLLVTIRNGKTGFRTANTMPGAVSAYERIRNRYPGANGEDYIFLPGYTNRSTAARIFQRQFNYLLDTAAIKHDPLTNQDHTIIRCDIPQSACESYCLRVRSISLISQKTLERALNRSKGSMHAIYRCRKKWLGTCKVLASAHDQFSLSGISNPSGNNCQR
jgi:hypothetical protein